MIYLNAYKNKITPLSHRRQQLVKAYLNSKDYRDQMYSCIFNTVKRKVSDDEFDELKSVAYEGLIKAARNFKTRKGARFKSFAYLNIQTKIISYIEHWNKKCRKPEQEVLSLQYMLDEEDGRDMLEMIDSGETSISDNVQDKNFVEAVFELLTPFQRRVTEMLMYNYDIPEICRALNCNRKQVDAVKNYVLKTPEIVQRAKQYENTEQEDD